MSTQYTEDKPWGEDSFDPFASEPIPEEYGEPAPEEYGEEYGEPAPEEVDLLPENQNDEEFQPYEDGEGWSTGKKILLALAIVLLIVLLVALIWGGISGWKYWTAEAEVEEPAQIGSITLLTHDQPESNASVDEPELPPPPPTGACCFADGTWFDGATEADCGFAGGAWHEGLEGSLELCPQPITIPEPPVIEGMALWLDAADPDALVVDNGYVSGWKDKSSNLIDYTQADDRRPSVVPASLNGLTVLSFDGINDGLTGASGPIPMSQDEFTCAVVWNPARSDRATLFDQPGKEVVMDTLNPEAPLLFKFSGELFNHPDPKFDERTPFENWAHKGDSLAIDFNHIPVLENNANSFEFPLNPEGNYMGVNVYTSPVTFVLGDETFNSSRIFYQTMSDSLFRILVYVGSPDKAIELTDKFRQRHARGESVELKAYGEASGDPIQVMGRVDARFMHMPAGMQYGFPGAGTSRFYLDKWHVSIMRVDDNASPNVTMRDNGEDKQTSSSSAGKMDLDNAISYIGHNAANAEYFQGQIAEIMVFNRRLTDSETDNLEDYFNVKYGLAQ